MRVPVCCNKPLASLLGRHRIPRYKTHPSLALFLENFLSLNEPGSSVDSEGYDKDLC
jgi:hypothetical protein